jgi:hypothetical protein
LVRLATEGEAVSVQMQADYARMAAALFADVPDEELDVIARVIDHTRSAGCTAVLPSSPAE